MQLRGPGQWLELAEEKLSSCQTRPALTLSLSLVLMGELEHRAHPGQLIKVYNSHRPKQRRLVFAVRLGI